MVFPLRMFLVYVFFALSVEVSSNPTFTPIQAPAGVLGISEPPIVLVSGDWKVVFNLPWNSLFPNVSTLFDHLADLHRGVQNLSVADRMYTQLIWSMLDRCTKELAQEIDHIQTTLLATSRVRRGLFNFVGETTKVLFGIATTRDIRILQERLRQFRHSDSLQSQINHDFLLFMNQTKALSQRRNLLLEDMLSALSDIQGALQQMRSDQTSFNHVSAQLHSISTFMLATELTMMEWKQALLSLQKGFLPQEIIPINFLQTALADIPTRLPSPYQSAFELASLSVFDYYHYPMTSTTVTDGYLHIVLHVPLSRFHETLPTSRLILFPVAIPGLQKGVIYNVDDSTRIVSTPDSLLLLPSPSDWQSCQTISSARFCHWSHLPFWQRDAGLCAIGLFTNSSRSPELCSRRDVDFHAPYIRSIGSHRYLLSTAHNITLESHCSSGPSFIARISVSGAGILLLPPTCNVHHHQFQFIEDPMFRAVAYNISSEFGSIHLPNVSILSREEFQIFSEAGKTQHLWNKSDPAMLTSPGLQAIIRSAETAIRERDSWLSKSNITQHFSTHYPYMAAIAILVLLMAGSLLVFIYRGNFPCRGFPLKHSQKHHIIGKVVESVPETAPLVQTSTMPLAPILSKPGYVDPATVVTWSF